MTSFRVAEVYTVPRLRRYHQMGAAIWMAAEELEPLSGGSSILARAEERTRAALRRVGFSALEVDGCSVTVAKWLSADSGTASWCFPAGAGCMTGSRCFLDCQTPRTTERCRCQAATEHRTTYTRLVLHRIWNELRSEKQDKKDTNTEHDLRGRQRLFGRGRLPRSKIST